VDSEISPELALVCPDIAAEARASLPDRPWEVFVPLRPAIERIGPPPGAGARERAWPRRVSAAFPLVVLAGFVALLIVGSLPGLSQGPTLGPPDKPPVALTVPAASSRPLVRPNCPRPALC
jgi:hypothetical protein